MDDFFNKIQKMPHGHLRELAGLCATVALLLVAAAFVSNGGMTTVNNLLVAEGITPSSQTGCVFHCNNTSYSLIRLFNLQDNVLPGTPVTWVWNAGTYGANTFTPSCFDYSHSGFGGHGFGFRGSNLNAIAGSECTLQLTPVYSWPVPDSQNNVATNVNGDGYYSASGGTTPVGIGYPGGRLTLPAPSNPGTYTYYLCSWAIEHGYGAGAGCTGTNLTVVSPNSPTTLTSFTASPSTIVGSGASTLAWAGIKGTNFSACELTGGQWGSGTWFSALPGSIQTNTLAQGTYTYGMNCFDTTGASTGLRRAVVTVTAPAGPCADIPAVSSVPSGCANPTPPPGVCTPTGGSYSPASNSCSCPVNTHLSGSVCVANTCGNGLSISTYPSCTCPVNQHISGSICVPNVPVTCSNGLNASYAPGCNCAVLGKEQSGAVCVDQGVIDSLTANPSRVLKGNTATVTWSTSHMSTCALSGFAAAGTSALSSVLSSSVTPTINSKTIFTLSCVDAAGIPYSSSVTVNLIPQTIEK